MYSQLIVLVLAILSFATLKQTSADFGYLFITNEEIIVLVCFIAFVVFCYRSLSSATSLMLHERKENIGSSLQASLVQTENQLLKEINKLEGVLINANCVNMIKDSLLGGGACNTRDNLRSMIGPLCQRRVNIILSQQTRSALSSCYSLQATNREFLRNMIISSFRQRSAFSISKLRKKNK